MSQCLFSSVPARSFIHVNLLMVLSMWLTHYDHQLRLMQFIALIFCSYLLNPRSREFWPCRWIRKL